MSLLFKTEDVKRYFNILERLGRCVATRYKGYYNRNSDYSPCEREVFVNRTLNKWFPEKCIILYENSEFGIPYKRYIIIRSIRYSLTHGVDLNVSFTDCTNPYTLSTSMSVNHNKAINLEGVWKGDSKIHTQLLGLIEFSEEEYKDYTFEGYDFNLPFKKKKKNMTTEEHKNQMKSFRTIRARTFAEARELLYKEKGFSYIKLI